MPSSSFPLKTTNLDACVQIKMGKEGPAAAAPYVCLRAEFARVVRMTLQF